MTRYIKVRMEFVLPVPHEVTDDLDAVAEAGLQMLRDLITTNVKTLQPGTLATSWQSMPKSWAPKKASNIVLMEEVSPGVYHEVDNEDRVSFIEEQQVTHPWDQGLFIFPDSHPLHMIELEYYSQYVRTGHDAAPKQAFHGHPQVRGALREIGAGDDDDE